VLQGDPTALLGTLAHQLAFLRVRCKLSALEHFYLSPPPTSIQTGHPFTELAVVLATASEEPVSSV